MVALNRFVDTRILPCVLALLAGATACGGKVQGSAATEPGHSGNIDGGPYPEQDPPFTLVPPLGPDASLDDGASSADRNAADARAAKPPSLNANCSPGTLAVASYPVGGEPAALALGDVDGDGRLDVVVANRGTQSVSVLLGAPDAGLSMERTYATGTNPTAVGLADLNGDGHLDVVVANNADKTVSVLLGDGKGGLRPQVTYAAASYPSSIAIGDVNGDAKLDLVVTNAGSDDVSVLLGNGDGTFQLENEYGSMIVFASSLAMRDLNGDGVSDLAMVGSNGVDGVTVMTGARDGTFGQQQSFVAGIQPTSLSLGDFDGDGQVDAVIANIQSYNLTFLKGDGHAGFTREDQSYGVTASPTDVVAADLNGDGALDLVVGTETYETGAGSASVYLFLGNGDGSFRTPTTFLTDMSPTSVAVGDMNGDGALDIVTANKVLGSVTILTMSPCGGTPGTLRPSACVNGAACTGQVTLTCAAAPGEPGCSQTCICSQGGIYCNTGCL